MQAVILAAGKSQRFYPFTSFSHKSIVKLMGKPLLQYTLEALKLAGFSEVIIVITSDSTIPNEICSVPGLKITFVVQKNAEGMGNALLQAKKFLNETFFVLNGYHMEIGDFAQRMQHMQKNRDEVVLLAKEEKMVERYGVLTGEKDFVVSLKEKPSENSENELRIIGIYLLNKSFIALLTSIPVEQYQLEKALDIYAKKRKVYFLQTTKPTLTLKHSWDILSVKDYLLSKVKRSISKNAVIAKNALIEGDVIVSDGVKILEGACVKGPCFLGKNVIVGNNAILRNGVIAEEHVVIGANMEVKNAVLMRNVTTHTGFIGDSVIGPHSRIAAGFCTANVRFDRAPVHAIVRGEIVDTYRVHLGAMIGEGVDTGINVSTMPGISIGNDVTIGPSSIIMENVEEHSLLYTKFATVLKKKKNE
jgi:NDP-sugar pyrophosphorylase family protein